MLGCWRTGLVQNSVVVGDAVFLSRSGARGSPLVCTEQERVDPSSGLFLFSGS